MKLLILDRDGVINQDSAAFIRSPEEWHAIPGSLEAIARASRAGIRVVLASNQSGLGRGLFDIEALNGIHQKMLRELANVGGHIEAIFFCPHHPDQKCSCRKPQPGLYEEIARRLRISLKDTPCVVDRLTDVAAVRAAGGCPCLVLTGQGKKALTGLGHAGDVRVYADLAAAVDELLATIWRD